MISMERLQEVHLNVSELVSVLTEEEFDYRRAARWMDGHVALAVQAIVIYLVAIFGIKFWMRNRQPYNLKLPLAIWNFVIANLSGLSALAMCYEYFYTLFKNGVNETICNTQEEFFTGRIGYAVFVLLLARLPEFMDTFFIVLRKQKLMFIHWYHHTATLLVGWVTYSAAFPAAVHLIFVNALIHLAMYSYYFLTALNFRPPPFVAKLITIFQIAQFFMSLYGLVYVVYAHFLLEMPCMVESESFLIHWMMILSYTYLFVDFFITKYVRGKQE
ncbi:hypothetical protein PENTCL1PPCAC_14832, partial [Pristionchus entomophagus]